MGLRLLLLLLASLPSLALAQRSERARLAEQTADPISGLAQISFFNDVDMGLGDEDQYDSLLMIHPRFPLRLEEDWSLLVWAVLRYRSAPPPSAAEDRVNGFEDTVVRLLLTPTEGGAWRWGVGPAVLAPTATRDALGTRAFGLGGVVVGRFQGGPWTAGTLVQYLASVRGAEGRRDFRQAFIRPFVAFTTPAGVTLGVDSETLVDWESPRGDRWLVPIELTLGQVAKVGNQLVNLEIGGRYYLDAPTGGPDWGLRLVVTFLFPVEPASP